MKSFFLFLDILGFKNIVNSKSEEELEIIINTFNNVFNQAIDKSRTIEYTNLKSGEKGSYKINLNELNFRLISDSIIIWGENDNFNTFRNLLDVASELLSFGVLNGFPLRGAMTYGEIILHSFLTSDNNFFSNESIYGKALVEAYSLESTMEWSGCILTPTAWNKVREIWCEQCTFDKDPNAYFTRYAHLIWYTVPFKENPQKYIAINWNNSLFYEPHINIDVKQIEESFKSCGESNLSVEKKLAETLNFLDYTNQLWSSYFSPLNPNCIPNSNSIIQKSKKAIPVPNESFYKV